MLSAGTSPVAGDRASRQRRAARCTGRALVRQVPAGVFFGVFTALFGDIPFSWLDVLLRAVLFILVTTAITIGPHLWRTRDVPAGVSISPRQERTVLVDRDPELADRIVGVLESLPAEVTSADPVSRSFVARTAGRWGTREEVAVTLVAGPDGRWTARVTSTPHWPVDADGGRGYRSVTAVAEHLRD